MIFSGNKHFEGLNSATESRSDVVEEAWNRAEDFLTTFATRSDFRTQMQVTFGHDFEVAEANRFAAAWLRGELGDFPAVEIRDSAEINGANGAFAAATNTIYLSREFVDQNADNLNVVTDVLLEEYGHYIDSRINVTDTGGDEGEIFAALVRGEDLSAAELAVLKGEDDEAIVFLDGEEVAIEQAEITTNTDTLDFFANDVNLSQNPFSEEFRYTDFVFRSQLAGSLPFGLNADIFDSRFDYDFNASIGLVPFLQLKQLGKTTFNYPLSVNTSFPNQLDLNETSLIETSDYQVEVKKSSITGSGFSLLKAGLDFEYDLGPWKIDSFIQSNLLDLDQNKNLIDLPKIKDKINFFETSFDVPLVDINAGINLGEFVELKAALPEIAEFQQKTSTVESSLPFVEATGKTQEFISLSADIDKFLVERAAVLSLPLTILIAAIDTVSKKVTRETPLELNFNGLGFSLKFPKDPEARVSLEASLDILDVSSNLKLGFQQDLKLVPDVQVTMSVDKGLVDGSLNSTKPLGEVFNITAPSEGSGIMEVKAKYELQGNLDQDLDLILDGGEAIKAEILKAKSNLNLGLGLVTAELPPLASLKIPEALGADATLSLKTLVSSNDSNASVKIDPLQLQKIEGIERDENNPQANATKNLIVEKVYKIPYGVPLSISDAASVTEGTEQTNASTSRQSQAYFTYNDKYYEWQPRIVQPFTGSGGDVLSRISLETLGDASPNAYNFIAFQNNIPDPNLIIAGSTIQVPKEVPLPDTTGYAVFEVSSSGGSAKTNYNTADGTATAGSDYLAASGTLSIPSGQGGVILVPIVPDTEQEETETFTVTLTRPDGTPISEGVEKLEATGTINDDDKKPDSPENKAVTYNDPRIVTFDGQYHDFQAAGEFTLINTLSGDLKIQVRQQPVGNNPNSNVTDNAAVAALLCGKRIGLYKDTQQLLIDGVPTEIPYNNSLVVGDGRIYREGNIYTLVYPTGDQLVAKVLPSRINLSVFLTEERQGQIQGLLGNFNGNLQDDLAKRDGTVLSEPVTPAQLYGEYADSWRITQAESLFDYKPGETTNSFTLPNFPIRKVTLADLNPADIAKAEERIGDSITDPTIREAAIIDYILTGFDDTIIEEAIASPTPEGILAIVVPPQAFADFADTTNNIPVTLDVLSNDTGTLGVPLSIADFNPTTPNGGTIGRNDNSTPDNPSDDVLTYTPPANFVGTDSFNYTLSDGTQIAAGTVTVNVLEPIVIPLTAVEDIAVTTTNTPVTLDVLSNDSGMPGVPISIANFDPTTPNGGNIDRNDNGTPNDPSDDVLAYTPPANFVGRDRFNYTLSDGVQIAAGSVTIAISATPTPLISELNLATLNGSNGFALNGINPGDFSGIATTSIGDFNRDGFDDVAIGGFGADPNGINAAGETYILFGTSAGFPANFNLANLNGTNGFILNGIDAESFSGGSLSRAGDFNGDGFDDLIIGAFAASANSQDDSGKTYIVFGTSQSFPTRFDLSQLNGSNGFVLNGQDEFDYVGIAVNSAGDINADGFDDLLIAAPGALGGESGKTYIFYGGSRNIPANLTLDDLEDASEELLAFTRGFQQPISAAISRGHIVVSGINSPPSTSVNGVGDLNGDGFDDVAVAPEPNEDNPISETYVLFGSASGFGNLNLTELDSNNGFILTNLPPNANPSLSRAGDVNDDGIDDLLLGVPEATVGDLPNVGKTYVVFGNKEGFGDRLDISQLDGSNGFVLNGSEADELSGTSVSAAGDINSDHIDDLIIGATGATVNDVPSAGKVYAVFGSDTGFPASLNLAELNGSNGFVLNGTNADDLTGISVSAAGDTNGDTIDDLIVGAPGNLFNNTPGKSYIVFGNPSYGIG